MEITITKEGGDTVMRLVNSGFSEDPTKDETYKGTVSGWANALTMMKVWLEQYPMRTRHHDLVVRTVAHTPEQLRPLYATVEGRALWLPPDVTGTGEVLCDSGPEGPAVAAGRGRHYRAQIIRDGTRAHDWAGSIRVACGRRRR